MNGVVKEWMGKADGDWTAAQLLFETQPLPQFDAVMFHAQQCIEKMMKAVLVHNSVKPPRTHDLIQLSESINKIQPAWTPIEKELRFLNQGAIWFRYPGESATRETAQVALSICKRLREELTIIVNS